MAKKEPPQEYIEVLEVLNVLYDEVDGCSFYDYTSDLCNYACRSWRTVYQ